jgi:lipoprotein-releasing system permease protein
VSALPSELQLGDVLTVAVVALGLSFAATLWPSYRAARIQPASALRYE